MLIFVVFALRML